MDLIFGSNELTGMVKQVSSGAGSLKDMVYHFLQATIAKNGKIYALGWICFGIIAAVLLKNLFLYLAFYFLAPIRNAVTRKYSKLLYNKVLQLPIGYFTEQRKGDILSRSSNDIAELESSIICALEGMIKEPLNIIGIIIVLFAISVKLTLFVFILLPLAGLIV